jgi:hypothetical protein
VCICSDGYQDNDDNDSCLADCTPAALTCSDHGTCDDTGGVAVCVCDEGYDSLDCGTCDAPYYQDFDEDTVCETTCYYEGDSFVCGTNEVCSDLSGTKECVCAPGYQDNDDNDTCEADCETAQDDETSPLVCPEANAYCDDADGTAACYCETGYTDDTDVEGDDCLACDTGYQDNDDNDTCLPNCATAVDEGLDCGSEGCDDSTGTAMCNCADGYQDNDINGTCEPNCTTAALGCDTTGHWLCDDSSGTAMCVCDTGYFHDGMGNCVSIGSGDDCSDPIPLDIGEEEVFADLDSLDMDFTFSCDWMGWTDQDLIFHVPVAADETWDVTITMSWVDWTCYAPILGVLAIYEGTPCTSATEIECGFGLDSDYYFQDSVIDVTLTGGSSGTDYYLVVGWYAYGGPTCTHASITIEHHCAAGEEYNIASDTCVDNPCLDPNPCTDANKTVCAADFTVDPTTYECFCDLGYVDDGYGACELNTSAEGAGCDDVIPIVVAEGEGTPITGSTSGDEDHGEGTCSMPDPAPDDVYGFTLTEQMMVNFEMVPDIDFDALMHLRTNCEDPDSQVNCTDQQPDAIAEHMSEVLGPGTYYLFVDGWDGRDDPLMAEGDYTLNYSFYSDPCAVDDDACPGEPVCHAHADWSGFDCVCEDEGELFYDNTCVTDPCLSATCGDNSHCVPDLSDSSYDCECDAIYIDDGYGGCMLAPDAQWTFMMYWAMDNNLYNQSLPEFEDWMNVNYNENVRMLVLVDPWDQDGYIAEMLPGEIKIVYDYGGDPDTGDWQTLADFGVWVVNHYPAEHYVLIPSDHGGAWRDAAEVPVPRSICHDEHTDNIIGVANGELAAALTAITNAAGQKLDFVIYDACLMATWEMAEVGAPFADYMLASEESQYGFQNYTAWLNLLIDNMDTITIEEFGEAFVDTYAAGGQFGYPGNAYAVTASLTDLSLTADLTDAVSGFADALIAAEGDTFYADLDQTRIDTQRMQYRFLVDLGDLARNVSLMDGVPTDVATAADALLTQLDETVVYDWANIHDSYKELTGATGLSIYLPSSWYANDYGYTELYMEYGAVWSQHSTWDEFLLTFLTGDGGYCHEGTEVIDYMGTTVGSTLGIDTCYRNNSSPHIAQSFIAPAEELHGVRVAVVKTEADGGEHEGFTLGVRDEDGHWLTGPDGYWEIEPNEGDVQYMCWNFWGLEVEPGEELELVLFGGEPHWSYSGSSFDTPISWPIEYAADSSSDPPYAAGDVTYDDGDGEELIQDYNDDGIRGTMWFEIY